MEQLNSSQACAVTKYMAHSAKAVANSFLDLAREHGEALSPMKLQKLVYFAHGWNLGLYGEPLINEQVEAWKFGPVIRSLYHQFKHFGHSAITAPASYVDPDTWEEDEISLDNEDTGTLPRDRALIERVWDVYKQYTPNQLSSMTHEPGSPWDHVFQQFNGMLPRWTAIPEDVIRKYFADMANAPKTV